jgi:hypothetical protein
MTRQVDERTLSAFLDGELDNAAMQEVNEFVQRDANAKQYILNAARTTAFLKATSNAVLHEEVPERLVDFVKFHRVKSKRRKPIVRSLFQIAAAIVFVFVGFAVNNLIKNNQLRSLPVTIAPVLNQYAHVVDAALENNLSGNSRQWNEPQQPTMIMVTPIKTYRDSNNTFFREYRLEVVTESHRQQVNGLAYRTAGGKWKTKALFFQDSTSNES